MKMFEKTSYITAFHELVFMYFHLEEGWQLFLEQQLQLLGQDGWHRMERENIKKRGWLYYKLLMQI